MPWPQTLTPLRAKHFQIIVAVFLFSITQLSYFLIKFIRNLTRIEWTTYKALRESNNKHKQTRHNEWVSISFSNVAQSQHSIFRKYHLKQLLLFVKKLLRLIIELIKKIYWQRVAQYTTMFLLAPPTLYFMRLIYADIIIHFNCDTQYLLNYTFEASTSVLLWIQNWGIN